MQTEYISPAKKAELEQELDFLKNTKRGEIAKELERTRSLGDLSENAEYHQAREEQGWTEDRILQIEHVLRTAEVVSAKKKSGDSVSIGSKVKILKKEDKSEKTIELVGSEEADAALGKISVHSPLGESLIGAKVKSEMSIQTPKGVATYVVVEIL